MKSCKNIQIRFFGLFQFEDFLENIECGREFAGARELAGGCKLAELYKKSNVAANLLLAANLPKTPKISHVAADLLVAP